ncbi:hypothetical protein CLI15_11785 [Brucella abortus]|nr:hypothetical protein CK802_11030 [Brucella abortus]ASZ89956.1 hypothetical protein CK803_11145 [Brucella abortus]ASZ92942.1 hypothetical protein CK805_11110 [Brucella abortus]ASZ95961.1 hypothetical protein CK804_11080 [Brucella abortus]ASZ98769.1 hypothetical protein CK806_11000 [Brucella abortus]
MNYRRVGRRRHDRLSKGSPWVCAHGDLTAILRSRKRFGRELGPEHVEDQSRHSCCYGMNYRRSCCFPRSFRFHTKASVCLSAPCMG